jgi:hypothetical protein
VCVASLVARCLLCIRCRNLKVFSANSAFHAELRSASARPASRCSSLIGGRSERRVDIRLVFALGGSRSVQSRVILQFNTEVAQRAKVAEKGLGRPLVSNSGRVPKMPVDESFPADPMIEMSRRRLQDVEIGFAHAGPPEGELVILLHGFPEHWGAWRHHMVRLAHAGFYVVAPDQRGYGLSSKPAEVADYDLDLLAADVVGLARHLGRGRFSLVGHDWGGSVTWWLASLEPAALHRMIVINAPHPAVWREAMDGDWRQWLKSLYVRVMRLPRLPEFMIRAELSRSCTGAGTGRTRFGRTRSAPRGLVPAGRAHRHGQLVSCLSTETASCSLQLCHCGTNLDHLG